MVLFMLKLEKTLLLIWLFFMARLRGISTLHNHNTPHCRKVVIRKEVEGVKILSIDQTSEIDRVWNFIVTEKKCLLYMRMI